MRSSASFHSSRSSTRTVPRNEPRCGMALAAMPALTAPQTSDMPDRGSTCRESSPGRSVISRPRASTRSTVSCGRAVCPPGPVSVMSIRSQAAVMAPVRRPTVPAGTEGSQCSANAREAPSSTPEATTSVAPPGMVSSAGWKIDPHGAGQPVERGQRHGDTQDDGGVHVVAAGVASPSRVEA